MQANFSVLYHGCSLKTISAFCNKSIKIVFRTYPIIYSIEQEAGN